MKKSILLVAMCLSMSVIVSSCKGEKKEVSEETEMHENHAADKADLAMVDAYKCPMDCEDGKTYDKEGKCPKCEMDLKKVEKEGTHEHENGEEHENHAEDHDSKEGHDKDADGDKGHEGEGKSESGQ